MASGGRRDGAHERHEAHPADRRRKPVIDAETVALFVKLEHTPARTRREPAFKVDEKALHKRLGLSGEYFPSMQTVLDRASGPCHPRGYAAFDAWHRCRAVRLQLLGAAAEAASRMPRPPL